MEPVLPFELTLEGVRAGGLTKILHRQLRAAIFERRRPDGFALPSTRQLAELLGVGRTTVIAAYDLLVSEGHALAHPGTRLAVIAPADSAPRKAPREGVAPASRESDTRIAKTWRRPAVQTAYTIPIPARCFRIGVPEDRHFDHDIWRRSTARALRDGARLPFNYGPAAGLPGLREAIASHVAFAQHRFALRWAHASNPHGLHLRGALGAPHPTHAADLCATKAGLGPDGTCA